MLAQVSAGNVDHTELLWVLGLTIIGGFFTLLAVIIPLLISTRRQASQANDAVNHRHLRKDSAGQEPLKAYDAILETSADVKRVHQRVDDLAHHIQDLLEWRGDYNETWSSLPPNLSSGRQVGEWREEVDRRLEAMRQRLDESLCLDVDSEPN
jgi:hypothetical protein